MFMIIFDPILYYLVNEREMGEGMFTSAQSRIDFGRRIEERMARKWSNANRSFVGWLEVINSAVGLSVCEAA